MLGRLLLSKYPDFYLRAYQLFPKYNSRLTLHEDAQESPLSIEKCIAKYEDFVLSAEKEWRRIPFSTVFNFEKKENCAYKKIKTSNAIVLNLHLNPYLKIFEVPSNWPLKALALLRDRTFLPPSTRRYWIAIVPQLGGIGVREIGIGTIGFNVVNCLSHSELPANEVIEIVSQHIEPNIPIRERHALATKEIEYLLFFGVLTLHKI